MDPFIDPKMLEDTFKKGIETHLLPKVNEIVHEEIKSLGLDHLDRKHMAFPGMSDEEVAKKSRNEKMRAFLKAVLKKDMNVLTEMKAISEGLDSGGGFLVPEEFGSEVDRVARDVGLVRKLAKRIPMSSDTFNYPIIGSNPTVAWNGELTNGSDGAPTFKKARLSANTLSCFIPVSNEWFGDTNVDVTSMLAELIGEAFAAEEDNQAFNGIGSPFTGLLQSADVVATTAASGHNTFATVDLDDYRDCITVLGSKDLAGACWVMNKAGWAAAQKLKENSQHVVVFGYSAANMLSGKARPAGELVPVGMLWDYPVYVTDQITATSGASTKFGVFGNFRGIALGDRQAMAMDESKEATIGSTNAFAANARIFRGIERISVEIIMPDLFTTIKTNS